MKSKPIIILFADDDKDDQLLVKDAFEDNRLANDLYFVDDGQELMDYLHRKGKYSDPQLSPKPDLILLDLNMPKIDGRQALKEIKKDNMLKRIPIVILTTSKAEEDIVRSYNLGVNSYITKPVTLEGMVDTIKTLEQYWFQIVKLPPRLNGD
jgi:CheY-like chemotaxis protein